MRYTVLIAGKTGNFNVMFPDCPGCVAQGATYEGALINAQDALGAWVRERTRTGKALPEPRPVVVLQKEDREIANALAEGGILATVGLQS